ncbi:MAG: ribose 5-phosphate isomerase B [Eggerthellaceae bacterium]|nr:ribose 5-phosphate isomerase B [Eggerthellaceae bacterium]
MKISIASDHAGFEEKQLLVDYIRSLGYDVEDRGPQSADRVDYPDFAVAVARDVAEGAADRGVLVCGTGIGMAVAANKVAGIRAANVTSPEFTALAREHNDANVVTVSGRFVSDEVNRAIVKAFLETEFGGGRHAGRVSKIADIEQGRL